MSWISLLHPSAQIALVIAAVVLVILIIVLIGFIAVKSKLNLKVGGQEISIGKDTIYEEPHNDTPQKTEQEICNTCQIPENPKHSETDEFLIYPSRSCGDCIRILRNISHITERKIRKVRRECMEKKMLFVDHKIDEIQEKIFSRFNKQDQLNTPVDNVLVPNLFLGRLELSMQIAKAEIRRSFKENGFHELSDEEYNKYLKTETTAIMTKIKKYLRVNYPASQIKLTLDQIDALVDNEEESLSKIIKDIYAHALIIDTETDTTVMQYENEYDAKTESFIAFKEDYKNESIEQ